MFKLRNLYTSNKQVLYLVSGLSIAQLIPLAFSPVLSRLFTPSDYAILAMVIALLNIVFEISTLKYDRAIVIAKSDAAAKNLLIACFAIAIIVGVSIFPLVSFIYDYYLIKDSITTSSLLSIATPFILIFMGTSMASGFWFQRLKAHKVIVVNKIVQMTSITFISILLGYWHVQNGLVIGYFIGWGILFVFTLYQLKKTKFQPRGDYNKFTLLKSLKDHKSFPKYNALPGVLNALAMSIPVFMVIDYYGTHDGGNFNMSRQLLLLPVGFISSSFSQVYYRKIAEAKSNKEKIFPHLKQMLLPGLYLGLPLVIIVMLFGPEIFSFVLGQEWELAGEFAQVYIVAVYVQFFALCLSIVFPVLDLIKVESIFKALYFILICGLFLLKIKSSTDFIIYYSLIEIMLFGSMVIYVINKAKSQ